MSPINYISNRWEILFSFRNLILEFAYPPLFALIITVAD